MLANVGVLFGTVRVIFLQLAPDVRLINLLRPIPKTTCDKRDEALISVSHAGVRHKGRRMLIAFYELALATITAGANKRSDL